MITPRSYQRDAISDTFEYILDVKKNGHKNPLIVSPTGTGKSVIISMLAGQLVERFPSVKIILLTHVQELVEQNFIKFKSMYKNIDSGVYSAGLRRRDLYNQVISASIQSIAKHAEKLGKVNILIVDECHTISNTDGGDTLYKKFINKLREANPRLRVIGLTATPYRLKGGDLRFGKDAIFDEICFEYPIMEALNDGYLTPLISKPSEFEVNAENVKSSGGDYNQKQLAAATNNEKLNWQIARDSVNRGEMYGKSCWLTFCVDKSHAENMHEIYAKLGVKSAVLVSGAGMKDSERKSIIEGHKSGEIKNLINVGIATTGYDNPKIDMINVIRKTLSPGLWQQMLGRGTRLIDGSMGNLPTPEERKSAISCSTKPYCLVNDYTGNTAHHGPLDQVVPPPPPGMKRTGEAPVKECPGCGSLLHASARNCSMCGHEFPKSDLEFSAKASEAALFSSQLPDGWQEVKEVSYVVIRVRGELKICVSYYCGQKFTEILSVESNWPKAKDEFIKWWGRRVPNRPAPRTCGTFMALRSAIPQPLSVKVSPLRVKGRLTYKVLDISMEKKNG